MILTEYIIQNIGAYQDTALLLARVIVGVVFFYYGWPKIKNLRKNAKDFEGMGFKPGWFWGTPIALLETGGSALLILGIFSEIWALLFAIHMIVGTIWKITKTDKGFSDWSYDILLLALALIFVFFGGGLYSISNLFF